MLLMSVDQIITGKVERDAEQETIDPESVIREHLVGPDLHNIDRHRDPVLRHDRVCQA